MGGSDSVEYRTKYVTDPKIEQMLKNQQVANEELKKQIKKSEQDADLRQQLLEKSISDLKSADDKNRAIYEAQLKNQQKVLKQNTLLLQTQKANEQEQKKKIAEIQKEKNRIEAEMRQNARKANQQMLSLKNQIKSLNDPSKIKQINDKIKNIYWDQLKAQQFTVIQGKSVVFIGKTSVGKSSLLNQLFKTKQAVSKRSCTKQISIVAKIGEISIFDCPGMDEHFSITEDPQKIPKYLGCIQHIYYLYDGYIQKDVIKTFMAMKKKFYGVRTRCDPGDDEEENNLVRQQDINNFKEHGCQTEVFLTSKHGGADNQKLLKHILENETPVN